MESYEIRKLRDRNQIITLIRKKSRNEKIEKLTDIMNKAKLNIEDIEIEIKSIYSKDQLRNQIWEIDLEILDINSEKAINNKKH